MSRRWYHWRGSFEPSTHALTISQHPVTVSFRFSGRIYLHLALVGCAAHTVLARGAGAQSTPPATSARAAKPDYKNLRFDEVWTAASRSSHWDDAIKAIPILPGQPVTLTLGGQVRWREEFFRHFNLTPQDDDNSQSRVLLSADLQAGDRKRLHSRIFAEARDAQSYGRTLPGGARPADADRHDVQNLFADLAYGASFVRYGRQEIAINRERVFGVPDWSNTRRGSQGTRLQLVHGAVALEAIDARPVIVRQTLGNRADSTARFKLLSLGNSAGAAPFMKGLPAVWQGYWVEQVIRTSTAATTSLTRRLTSGGRTMWTWGKTPTRRVYSFELEGALQHGHAATRELDGWFWIAESQVQWRKVHGAPSLAIGIEEGSGENASTSNTQEAFAVLYPAAHAHGGYADVIGRTNARELHLISTWDPFKPINLRGAFYRFDRLRTDDGIWTKQNTVFRAAGGSTERHAADEFDLTGTWKTSRHWRVIAGGALVIPGDFLKQTSGSAQTEKWGFVGTAFTF